jgi:hypothetical protein
MISFTRQLPDEACPRCNTPGAIASRDLSVWLLATVMGICAAYLVAGLTWMGSRRGLATTAFSVFSLTFILGRGIIQARAQCTSCGARRSWRGRWLP